EQAHAGRIGDQQLVRFGPDDRRQLACDPRWPVDPAMLVPAGDKVLAPLPLGGLGERSRRSGGQRSKRIAIKVDHALRQPELLTRKGERVSSVESSGFFESHVPPFVTPDLIRGPPS